MKYSTITEKELDQILDAQFNPPESIDPLAKNNFYEEWKATQSGIKTALKEIGFTSWNDGGEDYTMPDDWGYSRHHEIEIHRESMLDEKVLVAIQKLLKSLPEDYEVIVLHDLFLRHEIAPFHVVVRRNELLAQSDDIQLLRRLGLEK